MTFEFPDGLAPEVYSLAWLVGSWRGEGVISYPGIAESAFVNEMRFDHDGGPYVSYRSTIRLVPGVVASPPEPGNWPDRDPTTLAELVAGEPVWSTESGYWRPSSERPDNLDAAILPLEVLLADPAGRVSVYLGSAGNGRVDLSSDLIARTSTASEVGASTRAFGLVDGRLLWVWELAAFGEPLQSYASAQLTRILDEPQ